MALGIPMEFGPAVSVPGLFGVQVIYPLWIVAAWGGLWFVVAALCTTIDRLWRLVGYPGIGILLGDRSDHRSPERGETDSEGTYTVERLKEALERERAVWRWQTRRAVRSVVYTPLVEELTFRGVPFLIALTFTGRETLLWLLLSGHVLWAFAHRHNSHRLWWPVLSALVGGLLGLYFWLIGLWWLGVLVHCGHNAVASIIHLLRLWWRQHTKPFRPGEERTVTILESFDVPMDKGLYGTLTEHGNRLYVAELTPGETARVRVAYSSGFCGYAFPLEDLAEVS